MAAKKKAELPTPGCPAVLGLQVADYQNLKSKI
jgi:hypothetical protein